jgi:hypothetical protein
MRKRISLLLTLVFVFSLMPSTGFSNFLGMPVVNADSEEMYFVTSYILNYTDVNYLNEVWASIVGLSQRDVQLTDYEAKALMLKEAFTSVAIAPNRNIIVAWSRDYDSVTYAVLNAQGDILRFGPILHKQGFKPCVAATPDGMVFIVWEYSKIGYNATDSSGDILWSGVINRPGNPNDPTVAASTLNPGNNRVVIAWSEFDGKNEDIWFTVWESDGSEVKTPTRVTNSFNRTVDVNAAIMPNGNFVLVWEAKDTVEAYYWIYYAVFNREGIPVKGPTRLTNTRESRDPAVSPMDGSAIIVWEEGPSDSQDIYYAVIDGQGEGVKPPEPLTTSGADEDDADCATDGEGRIVVVYEQSVQLEPEEVNRIAYALLDPVATIINPEIPLTGVDPKLFGGHGMRFVAAPMRLGPVGGEILPLNTLFLVLLLLVVIIMMGATRILKKRAF